MRDGLIAKFIALLLAVIAGCMIIDINEALAAEGTSEKVADLKKRGNQAMERGRPADALSMYQAAYATEPNAALLYNIGRAYQALADYPQALSYITRFDREAPQDLKRRVPNLDALLEELRGRVTTVTIRVNIDGADVRLGNKRLGRAPIEGPVQVNSGTALLEVSAEGYLPHEQVLQLAGGTAPAFTVKLESKDTHGSLQVRSPEPTVRVLVDGKMRGMVPLELRLAAGQHRIELRKEGFETVSTTAVVEAGKRKELTIQLEETPAVYERWWFWTGIGVVATGTVTAIIVYGKEKDADVGTIPPGQVSGSLSF